MKKYEIITEKDIDEDAAREFLQAGYKNIELFPCAPEIMTDKQAAALLNVSKPTIQRMVEDGQITLTKKAIISYIQEKMLVNRPLSLSKNNPNTPKTHQIAPQKNITFS